MQATYNSLLLSSPNIVSRSRLLAAARSESGAWIHAFPMSAIGLRMDDDIIRVAIGLRLGGSLCRPHSCVHCGNQVDHLGHHGLRCRKSQGRHPRHAAINDIIKRALTSAKIPSHLESIGISDLMEPPFCHGSAVGFWLGMQPALIRLLLLTQYWLLRKQALWPMKQRRGRQRNIPLFLPPTILFPSPLKLLESLDKKHFPSLKIWE